MKDYFQLFGTYFLQNAKDIQQAVYDRIDNAVDVRPATSQLINIKRELIVPQWRHMAFNILVSIGSGKKLEACPRQCIIWTQYWPQNKRQQWQCKNYNQKCHLLKYRPWYSSPSYPVSPVSTKETYENQTVEMVIVRKDKESIISYIAFNSACN